MPGIVNLTSDLRFTPTTRFRRDGSIAGPGESFRDLTNVSTSNFSANPTPYEVTEQQNNSPLSNNSSQLRYPFEGPPPSRDGNEALPQVGENLINVNNTTPSEFRNTNTAEYAVTRAGDSPLLQPIRSGLGKTLIQSAYRNIQPSGLEKGGAPYIWTPVPGYDDPNPRLGFGPDVFGRAGYIESGLEDVKRLTKWGTDGFSTGALYTLKQTALALSSPKTLAGVPRRIYNPANTLAQIAVGAISGVHLNRMGILPIAIAPSDKYEGKLRNEFNGNEGSEGNRLVALKTLKLNGGSIGPAEALRLDVNRNNEGQLLQYLGGPDSVLGIGQTRIKRYEYTEEWAKNLSSKELKKQVVALTYNQLENEVSITNLNGTGLGSIGNFALVAKENSTASEGVKKTILGRIANYAEFNRVKTYNAGDPGNSQNLDREAYYQGLPKKSNEGLNGIDNINYQSIYASNDGPVTDGSLDDIIKFYFAVLDNDDPQYKVYTHFRAYLTNFSDDHSAEWNSFKYMGRGESFRRYQGYDRSISLGFKVHVGSRAELFPTYDKLNYLASVMAPDYSSGGFMRGNLVEVTVGDYLNNVPGIIEKLEFQFPNDVNWEIARKDDGTPDPNSAELPTLIEVSMNFKPIHKFLPRTVKLDTVFDRKFATIGGTNDERPLPESQFISMGSDNKGYKPYSE